ncbi:flagellar hook protein FlgE [Gallaecimonas xiamenensis]|uniref:Flagellar hook protein FlgE n=1 Tax=Gallaecimonas xiamenensis 3-C-1 TaxID=745411 RepID=K2JM06_9GAMM|nr:flagellar hook protein FlgE [Gallaecimonas xiamenensis]EKE75452.1 flagellar hook protein FlgE [Gallaecimonas xiamenensis 3-C-1]
MSFNISLSGLNAAQKDLDVTSNNISNANTYGFKQSRAEFADVYASSIFSNPRTKVGDGAVTSSVAQQFHQGALQFTNNTFDLAINGNGFFALSSDVNSNELTYTRAGNFKLNKENYVVDNQGNYLKVFPVNPDGTSASAALSTAQSLQVPDSVGTPLQTGNVNLDLNLPAGAPAYDVTQFDPTKSGTYNNATSVTIYDSLGQSHTMTTYYIKDDTTPNTWNAFAFVDGKPVSIAGSTGPSYTDASGTYNGYVMNFDSTGQPGTPPTVPATLTTDPLAGVLTNGSDGTQTITLNYQNQSQFADTFTVNAIDQDGLTVGRLTGVEVGADGLVRASYSNGTTEPLGRVALVRFANEQGLSQAGNTGWKASTESGEPLAGEPDSGTFGNIRSGALESSNVDLTQELVDLITAQRNFQANSRAIEVSNTLQQNILQIR